MRCLLIATNLVRTPYPVYPLALACLAGALRKAGHEVEQFDCLGSGEDVQGLLSETIDRFRPELIGLSIRNLDSEDSSRPESFVHDAARVMAWVRSASPAPVVVGGAAFSLMPERIMDLLGADYGIVGEGEQLVVELAGTLEADKEPAERIMRASLSPAPWRPLAFDNRICAYYLKRGGILNVQTKRGCPYHCAYCSYPLLEGRQLRAREPEAVVEDVLRLQRDFGARYVFFTDSVFNDPGDTYLEICETLVRKNNRLPWTAYFRPTKMERAHMDLMKRSGLDAMEIGTDCGCDTTLAGLNKGFIFDDAVALNDLAAEFSIPCAHFIMFGGPGETGKTVRESLVNLERLQPAVLMAFNGIRILPGTPLQAQAVKDGLIEPDQDLLEPTYYLSPRITAAEINTMLHRAWGTRPDRIRPGASDTDRIARFHRKGFTGPIWDKIVRMGWK